MIPYSLRLYNILKLSFEAVNSGATYHQITIINKRINKNFRKTSDKDHEIKSVTESIKKIDKSDLLQT